MRQSKGFGFIETLLLIFIILKVTDVITIGWLWVFSPLWIPFTVLVAMMFAVVVIMCILLLFVEDNDGR